MRNERLTGATSSCHIDMILVAEMKSILQKTAIIFITFFLLLCSANSSASTTGSFIKLFRPLIVGFLPNPTSIPKPTIIGDPASSRVSGFHRFQEKISRSLIYDAEHNHLENAFYYVNKKEDDYFISKYTKSNENTPHTGNFSDAIFVQEQIENKQVLIDETIFKPNGIPYVDLSGAKKIYYFSESIIIPIELFPRNEPPPLLISKVAGCCLYGIPPHRAAKYTRILESVPFRKENIRFISLEEETATVESIDKSLLIKSRLEHKPSNRDELESVFERTGGKTLILLGHTDKGNFIARDERLESSFTVPFSRLKEMAEKYNVDLIQLGCNTAQQAETGIGVTERINTVDAVKAIDDAIAKSKNYVDLLSNIAANLSLYATNDTKNIK